MARLVRAELRKMLTVRTTYLLAAGAAAVAVLTVFAGGSGDPADAGRPLWEQQSWFFTTMLTRLLLVLLGIRIVTEEYRYGTLTPALLVTGSRTRLLLAKVLAAALGALTLVLVAQLSLVVASMVFWAQRGVGLALTPADAAAMAGMAAAGVLYAALGVGLGFLLRQPVPATVGAVIWLLVGEDLLGIRIGDAAQYLPGYAGLALAVGPQAAGTGSLAVSAAVLIGWTTAAVLGGGLLLRRRDVG